MQALIAGNWKMLRTAAQLCEIAAIAAMVRSNRPAADVPINARAILALLEVGGALIGGARLIATDFDAIVASVPAHA